MNFAQRLWTRAVDGQAPRSAGGKHDARDWQEREEGRNANELAAQAIATTFRSRPLTYEELRVAGPLAHFAFGAALGALYGFCTPEDRQQLFRRGAAFGGAVWLLADEVAMPLLRLSLPTTERPLEKHLQSFASHMVFGVVAELIRAQAIANSPTDATECLFQSRETSRLASFRTTAEKAASTKNSPSMREVGL